MTSPMRVLSLLIAVLPSYAAPVITNGDFGAGDTAFTSGLSSLGNPCPNSSSLAVGSYGIDTNASNCDNTALSFPDHSGTGNMLIANPNGPSVDVWAQSIAGMDAGHYYTFSAYVHPLTTNSGVSVQFYFDGSPVGSPLTLSNSGSTWDLLTVTLGPPGLLPGSHLISIRGGAVAIDGLGLADPARSFPLALDDISVTDIGLTPIPEPSSAALTMAALLLFGAIRKRRTLRR